MSDTVSTTCYLRCSVSRRGIFMDLNTPSVTKNKPVTGADEIAIQLRIELPKTLFTRPQIEAHIQVPEDSVIPPVVSMEVQDNIREIAATQGLVLEIKAPEVD